jgi:hypothetical protein
MYFVVWASRFGGVAASRRAIRGSLRSYLRASRLVRAKGAPLLSLSLSPPPFSREGVGGWVYALLSKNQD